jgi:predicted PurR-regulated permease PerM
VANVSTTHPWQRALIILAGTVVGVVVIAGLYWARVVFIPVAVAVYLVFLLSPLVKFLQRRGLSRLPSVLLTVLATAVLIGGLGWVIVSQVSGLVRELPTYTANINAKIKYLKEMSAGSARLERMIEDISTQLKSERTVPEAASSPDAPDAQPSVVVVKPESSPWVERLSRYLGSFLEFLAGLALTLVLAVFMLLKREELRNRFIRLVGHGQLTYTTKAVDEAGQRISRYLLTQLCVNATFGLALGLGLFLIGVHRALLWGLLAGLLRYVPYVGALVSSVLITALSLAMFATWWQPLFALGLVLALELLTNNVVEPWVYGQSIGVSAVALLVSAAFWAFLWGPIGLMLSGPLTVCLVVLGKYVPRMAFLDVLLGDQPPLAADISFYQRLLARDEDEATQLVLTRAGASTAEEVYDALLLPALNYVKRDRERDQLTEADERFVVRATREILEDLSERKATAAAEKAETADQRNEEPGHSRVRVFGCPGHDELDALALEMLRQILDPARWQMEVLSEDMLAAELVTLAGEKEPPVVCIGALPPGGLAHSRYLCKRLRARLPEARIVVGRWGLNDNVEQNRQQLQDAGADQMDTTLLDTRKHLRAWLPVLTHEEAKTRQESEAQVGAV